MHAKKVEWLVTELGFTRKDAARVIFANPGVLLSSVDGSLMPKISWFADALQMEEEMVVDMIRRRVCVVMPGWRICRGRGL